MNKRSQPSDTFQIKIHKCAEPTVSNCSCAPIDKVASTKYLGIMLDQRLSWHSHCELIMNRIRKLSWTFKTLRHIADKDLLRQIYISLAQSVITYCLPIWGGANKSKFIELERAQRYLLKVIFFKPYRFPTDLLYSCADLLTVRKLYILNIIAKKHKSLPYNPCFRLKRRNYTVAKTETVKTSFAKKQYPRQSAYLYNIINKELDIYSLTHRECKKTLTEWLKTKSYDEIESLLQK